MSEQTNVIDFEQAVLTHIKRRLNEGLSEQEIQERDAQDAIDWHEPGDNT